MIVEDVEDEPPPPPELQLPPPKAPLIKLPIELNFKDRDKNEFDKLEKMVSEIQVSDTIQYGLELKKLDKSMLNLIFKMKKDLEKKGKV